MTDFISGTDLASYLDEPLDGAINNIVKRTNALVTEEWGNPVDPAPEWVVNIAWDVAIRAGVNRKGVTSQTRSWDDVTKTERWETGATGVRLTDAERRLLNGVVTADGSPVAVGSISMRIPGWDKPPCL